MRIGPALVGSLMLMTGTVLDAQELPRPFAPLPPVPRQPPRSEPPERFEFPVPRPPRQPTPRLQFSPRPDRFGLGPQRVCGMQVIPADPTVDPEFSQPVPEGNFHLRVEQPPMCQPPAVGLPAARPPAPGNRLPERQREEAPRRAPVPPAEDPGAPPGDGGL